MSLYGYFRDQLPGDYLAGAGEALWRGLGDPLDVLVLAAKDAVRARLPRLGPVEALPHLAANYDLDYPARLSVAEVRGYLADPWSKWRAAGTRRRLLEEIALLGYPQAQIVAYRDLVDAGQPPTVFGGISSFWYLVIKKPNPWQPPGKWGADGTWRGGAKWGSTATWQEIQAIRRVIAKWKPAASSCRFIEAWLQVSLFGLPTRIVRWPVHEDWEQSPGGGYPNFYNTSF